MFLRVTEPSSSMTPLFDIAERGSSLPAQSITALCHRLASRPGVGLRRWVGPETKLVFLTENERPKSASAPCGSTDLVQRIPNLGILINPTSWRSMSFLPSNPTLPPEGQHGKKRYFSDRNARS